MLNKIGVHLPRFPCFGKRLVEVGGGGEGEGLATDRGCVACKRSRDKSQFEYRHTQMLLGIKLFSF